jgi:hypothetical protein
MKVKVNIREHLDALEPIAGFSLSRVAIGIDDLFESNNIPDEQQIDVHNLLAEQHAIALIWDTEQVRNHYPHLTEEQAWEVLQECERNYKGEEGLTWDDIAGTVQELYPEPQERHWQGRIDIRITDTDGYGPDEVITRLRDMADLLAKDMPDVKADVDPGAIRLLDSDETASQSGGTHEA